MKCPNCGNEIPDDSKVCYLCSICLDGDTSNIINEYNDYKNYEETPNINNNNTFRENVLDTVDCILEITTAIGFILVLIIGIILIINQEFGYGFCTLILGSLLVAFSSWTSFCIIDMRESLKKIAKNTENFPSPCGEDRTLYE